MNGSDSESLEDSLVNPIFTATTASSPSGMSERLTGTINPGAISTRVESSVCPTTFPAIMLDLPTKFATNGVAGSSNTSRGVPNCMI